MLKKYSQIFIFHFKSEDWISRIKKHMHVSETKIYLDVQIYNEDYLRQLIKH